MKNISVIGMGEMGAPFAKSVVGCNVFTYLDKKRSYDTKKRVKNLKIQCMDSFNEMIKISDLIFSILPCNKALSVAKKVSKLKINRKITYVDCNPLSTKNIELVNSYFSKTNFQFLDACIIGPPPNPNNKETSFYISGRNKFEVKKIQIKSIKKIFLGNKIGEASRLKLLFSGINKGLNALAMQIFLASQKNTSKEYLYKELNNRIPFLFKRIQSQKEKILSNSNRYIDEMIEISEELKFLGFKGYFHKDAAALYKKINNANE